MIHNNLPQFVLLEIVNKVTINNTKYITNLAKK